RHSPGVPVTTNFTGLVHKPIDSYRWAAEQDVVSLDSYPDPHDPRAHIDAAFGYDLIRSARSGQPWLLMEQAPSAVNWRERNAPKPAGAMRLWSWQAVAQGADAVLFFQWRQAAGGAEKFHSAMVPHGGPGTRTHREIKELGAELAGVAELAGTRVHADVALLHDWDNWRAVEGDAHPGVLDLLETHRAHYAPLFDAHVTCDVVPPTADLSGYKMVVVPNLYLMSADVAARLTGYVRASGCLVVSFFSGIVDEQERVHLGGYPAPLRDVLGLRVDEFWPLPVNGTVRLDLAGERRTAAIWSEWIETEGAQVVATFAEGELAGRPAVTRHEYGDGVAWYLGTRPEPPAMRAVLDLARADAGAPPVLPDLPAGVQAVVRSGAEHSYLFLLNHGGEPASVALATPAVDLLGNRSRTVEAVDLAPLAVAVLRLVTSR
ncbi:beta-galactosidase, partial [Actinomadura sp. HBU206391]|uniref:beta-galactosidase n=1 Tax=Actinomadura sp. HBU206391 TaxID=2731692 RepID=UPI00164FB959